MAARLVIESEPARSAREAGVPWLRAVRASRDLRSLWTPGRRRLRPHRRV